MERAWLMVGSLWFAGTLVAGDPGPPHWIWSAGGDRHGTESVLLGHDFSLESRPARAVLRVTADFAALRVWLNGREALALDAYDPPGEVEVARYLRPGKNRIELAGDGVRGPSAVAGALTITQEGVPSPILQTGSSWSGAVSLGEVEAVRWADNRLPEVSPFAEYNQWREALESAGVPTLSGLPPGFVVERIRDAVEGEDSWISLALDSRDRIYLGLEEKGILRLTPTEDREGIAAAEKVEETLRECRGLAWLGDTLYVHANLDKGLYALRDDDGDGQWGKPVLLQATAGGSGHGRNALAVGPDKHLHAIVGDDVAVPEEAPRRVRPEAGAPKELGHWIRLRPGAPGRPPLWEAMTRGLRNPYGIAFNADGEAFTYDADNEGDVGLPFYRPSRINHLVSGANYGWHQDRGNTRSLPVLAPESVPTTYDVGRGSPTGVKFGTDSAFPSPWKEALFALDWAYGRILAIHLTPHGAGYQAAGEVFLEGRPLNVTDLAFDSRGRMWFVTGGRKTRSALYRVEYRGPLAADPVSAGPQEAARRAFSAKAREERRRLEQYHGRSVPGALAEIRPALASADPWLRHAARVALEWQALAEWRKEALEADPLTLGGLTAMLALARAGSDGDRAALAAVLDRTPAEDRPGRSAKLTLLRVHELTGAGEGGVLRNLRDDPDEAVRRELARALVRVGEPGAVNFSLEALATAPSPAERLHYLEVLAGAETGWSGESRDLYFNLLAHAKRTSKGDRFMPLFLEEIGNQALSHLAETERAPFAARLTGEPPEEAPVAPRAFVNHWTVPSLADPLSGPRDLKRGRELFSAALCARCHVCGPAGRPVGPDLGTVGRRFSRRDLVESIVEPSAVVAEVHRNVVVVRKDGTTVMGRVVHDDFRESRVTLATNAFVPSETVTLAKAEILSWEESAVSPMPPALLDTLDRGEVEDLLAFLLSGGATEP